MEELLLKEKLFEILHNKIGKVELSRVSPDKSNSISLRTKKVYIRCAKEAVYKTIEHVKTKWYDFGYTSIEREFTGVFDYKLYYYYKNHLKKIITLTELEFNEFLHLKSISKIDKELKHLDKLSKKTDKKVDSNDNI